MKLFKYIVMLALLPMTLLATEPTIEDVTKLYVATFNRAPDASGVNYWVNDSGLSLEEIAESFFDQQETQELYPSDMDNHSFIQAVYQNLFNRDPDPEGWDYWEQQLNSGNIQKSFFILSVINGALGDDATIIENKKIVGIEFVKNEIDDIDLAKTIMKKISADPKSIDEAKILIELKPPTIQTSSNLPPNPPSIYWK